MKRFIAFLLTLALCMPLLCSAASAAGSVSARTTLAGSDRDRISNIEIAANRLDRITVPCGGSFSFNDTIGPRTEAYGFRVAENGRGVEVTGGGVAQAATTLYLALRQLNGIEFTEVKTYGSKFTQNYVASGSDAILVDYSSGIDFSFINYGDDLLIEMWTDNDFLCCTLTPVGAEAEAAAGWGMPLPDFHTPAASASLRISGSDALINNILLAAGSINDTVLSGGDLFSFNGSVGPRTEYYGYMSATNGRGAEVVGGGVAQVASVIWLAVKNLDCIAIVEKSTYGSSYSQNYVSSSNDAISTDYNNGMDFSFRNTGSAPITISTYVTGDMLCCDIYLN